MRTDELRERFLTFFEERDHQRFASDSLVPSADPTLLFTSAGMNQFKDYFMGGGKEELRRATSSQKCFRTGDIENVGKTRTHLTFFEMLGNFSFGDYFKEQAILWGWELVTVPLSLEPEKLSVSVYEEDDEAYRIWHEEVGIPEGKIYRFGEGENFWPANAPSEGPNGPCGPCSEIHYDLGEDIGCGREDCKPGCCDRFSELYNLVFIQYERKEGGELDPLPQKNIDTGMGLERVAAVLQGKPNVFEIDIFQPVINRAAELLNTSYERETDTASLLRRIADHVRAATFLIGDGVLPSNEGRGYVERKILRRAVDAGLQLGQSDPLLYRIVDPVVETMKDAYPKIEEAAENAKQMIREEEKRYLRTIDRGEEMLEQMVADLEEEGRETLPGKDAFLLYDTYGFPLSRTKKILEEKGYDVDHDGFEEAMEKQRERAREETEISADVFGSGGLGDLRSSIPETNFVGYHSTTFESEILEIIQNGKQPDEVGEGEEAILIARDTPFYAEAGGQVGDTGTIKTDEGEFVVEDTQKNNQIYIHRGTVKEGRIPSGEPARFEVDAERRNRVRAHHSTTHILQAILRDELGSHVQQAGSLVAEDHLRFDFTHPEAIPEETLNKIEYRANKKITEDHEVESAYTTMEHARERGALMFFGDKYGDIVRTVEIGDFSLELCGGTHLSSTREASLFKITAESSVASGTRRIQAVAGTSAIEDTLQVRENVEELCSLLSTTPEQLPDRVAKLLEEIKDLKQELKEARQMTAGNVLGEIEEEKQKVNGFEFVVHEVDGAHRENLRSLVDDLVKNRSLDAAFLASRSDEKVSFALRLSERLQAEGLNAEELIRNAAKVVGGGGGGREDFAQAGGPEPENTDKALSEFEQQLSSHMS